MRGIIEPVDKIQRKCKDDAKQDEGFHADHEWFRTMSLSACPTSLHFSMTSAKPFIDILEFDDQQEVLCLEEFEDCLRLEFD